MDKFFVEYGDHGGYFVCAADDAEHAAEQCRDAYPDEPIYVVWKGTAMKFKAH